MSVHSTNLLLRFPTNRNIVANSKKVEEAAIRVLEREGYSLSLDRSIGS